MTNCCGSPTTKKSPDQSLSQPSKGMGRLDKIKAAFGFKAKLTLNGKNNVVRQQNQQKPHCG